MPTLLDIAPVLHLGVDIGVKRDTSAVVAVFRHPLWERFVVFCHKIWKPPVHIPAVTDYVLRVCDKEQVAGIWYDPSQYLAETHRLSNSGYGRLLNEVNQSGTFMVTIMTNLHTLISRCDFVPYKDAALRSHFITAAAKVTEAGPRVIKSAQSRPIDALVASGMALYGASHGGSGGAPTRYRETLHLVGVADLV